MVSRLDHEKRVDLLLDALENHPDLRRFSVRIYGTGWLQEELRERASRNNLPIEFVGFHGDVPGEFTRSDLLVHLCPVEPFGLAILEAIAAGVPVLVPDAGGAGSLVEDGKSGFRFRANDADDLARRIREIDALPAARLNKIASAARDTLGARFSEKARIADYRKLIEERLK